MREQCFIKVLEACHKEQWDLIERIDIHLLNQLTDHRGRSLFLACIEGGAHKNCLQHLMGLNLDIQRTDQKGNHALHLAVKYKRGDLIPLLAGKFLDERNHEKETALHFAILKGDPGIAIQLITEGLNKNAPLQRKGVTVTPLSLAVMEGQHTCIDALVQLKDPGLKGLKDPIPEIGNVLHLAIQFERLSTLKHLLNDHYPLTQTLIEEKGLRGRTPLALACLLGDERAVHFLCKEKKAHLTTKDQDGNAPLHLAVLGRHPNIVIRLISLGAEPTVLNHDNQTPLQLIQHLVDTSNHGSREKQTQNALIQGINKREFLRTQPLDFSRNPPDNLVFEGGGPKGVSYVGALEALQDKGMLNEVQRVAGTSAGAITATLVALGYSPREMKKILMEFDLTLFLDPAPGNERFLEATLRAGKSYQNSNDPLAALKAAFQEDKGLLFRPDKLYQLLTACPGLCEGEAFRKWIDDKITTKVVHLTGKKREECENFTFRQLKELFDEGKRVKHLHVFATRFQADTEAQLQRFSSEEEEWKDVIIADAVRCSMSIPGIYQPAHIYIKRENKRHLLGSDFYIDGGLIKNFPINAFDFPQYQRSDVSEEEKKWETPNRSTLGIALHCEEDISKGTPEIKSAWDLIKAIATLSWNAQNLNRESDRVLTISFRGIGLLDFNLTPSQKDYLMECGQQAVNQEFTEPGSLAVTQPGLTQLITNVPPILFNLVSRKEKLSELEQGVFEKGNPSAPIVQLLWGLGGMGKSELARHFANRYKGDFSIIWELSCEHTASLEASYISFADAQEIPKGENFTDLKENVHRFLELKAQQTNRPWLLIFDNVEENVDANMFPKGPGRVLITSRQKNIWKNVQDRIHVGQFSKEEAVELLTSVTGKPRTQEMEKLAHALEYFPVALSKAAHLIEQSNCGIQGFLTLYKPEEKPLDFDTETTYKYVLNKVWEITLQSLQQQAPDTVEWLNLCAYLNPGEIPYAWMEEWQRRKYPQKDAAKESNEIMKTLLNYDLMRTSSEGNVKTLSMHRLIQAAIQGAQGNQQTAFTEAFYFLKEMGEGSGEKQSEKLGHLWPFHFSRLFDPQHQELIDQISAQDRIQTLTMLVGHLYNDNFSDKNILVYFSQEGLLISQQTQDLKMEIEFSTMLSIGYLRADNLKEAEKHLHHALTLAKKSVGEGGQEAETLAKKLELYLIGISIQIVGKEEKSTEKCQQALKQLEEMLTFFNQTNHGINQEAAQCLEIIATVLNVLADLEENQIKKGEFKEQAKQKMIDALNISKQILPRESSVVINHQSNLGNFLLDLGQYQDALEYFKEAYQIEKIRNPSGYSMFRIRDLLGVAYHGLAASAATKELRENYLEKAKKQCLHALAIANQQPDINSTEIAMAYFELGKINEDLNQFDEAIQQFNKCYEILKKQKGSEHPDVKQFLAFIAKVEKKQKEKNQSKTKVCCLF